VIYSKYSGRAVALLIFLPLMLTAQKVQDSLVPLKNWTTPLYWHPSQGERGAAARTLSQNAPQLQFSSTAVSADALTFVAVTPCRLVDTRGSSAGFDGQPPFNGGPIPSGQFVTFPVQNATQAETSAPAPCGTIPSIAEAYSFNVTVIPQSGGVVHYLTVWPSGVTQPVVSTINDPTGIVLANAAIVPAGSPSGGISVYNSGPAVANVVIDMNGFFTAPTDLSGNTAIGVGTLAVNDGGTNNTATGSTALASNTSGSENTANGYTALQSNTTGASNTALGTQALFDNVGGSFNTANGAYSLLSNTSGHNNTACGESALFNNLTGNGNTGVGSDALTNNSTGINNAAIGADALVNNTTGNNNIAVGEDAASAGPAAINYSIYIGSPGTGGDLSGTIQIGTADTTDTGATIQIGQQIVQTGGTTIAGIYGGTPNASDTPALVCVDSNGLLGTTGCPGLTASVRSSIRFKEQVADMGDSSDKLLQLRPVTFHYKPQYDDGSHALQFGLIAEEVAKLFPEMVGYDKDGQPSSIQYQPLTPMLLNEVQKQHGVVDNLNNRLEQQDETIRQLQERLAAVESLLSKVPTTSTAGQ